MNGIHDLGGMQGFGPVEREENEPVFHAPWEGRARALQVAAQAQKLFNMDEFRHGVERMGAAYYLDSSYFEHWLVSTETNLTEKGIVSRDELRQRAEALRRGAVQEPPPREAPELLARILALTPGRDDHPPAEQAPRFAVGDRVVTRNFHPRGHTRLPRYARGKRGQIHRHHGTHTFPDANAHGLGKQPQPLYSVRFDARELWGDSAEPGQSVYLDLWESYLEAAP